MRHRIKSSHIWALAVTAPAVGLLVYSVSTPAAPAIGQDVPGREKERVAFIDSDSLDPATTRSLSPVKAASGGKITQPAATSVGDSADARFSGNELKNLRMGVIKSSSPVFDVPVAVPNTGTVEAGGACTCDSECTGAVCKVANCVAGTCVLTNAPLDTPCDSDGQFCTDNRCNASGVCQAPAPLTNTTALRVIAFES